MIQAFDGAMVPGFPGTAGPRMATAPKPTPLELPVLFALHTANGLLHLRLEMREADGCFLVLLRALLLAWWYVWRDSAKKRHRRGCCWP